MKIKNLKIGSRAKPLPISPLPLKQGGKGMVDMK